MKKLLFLILIIFTVGILFSFFVQKVQAATVTLRPNAAGDFTQLSQYPTSGSNYDKVDEASPDEDTTYVNINVNTNKSDLYNLPNHTTEAGTINFVKVTTRCKTNAANYGWDTVRNQIKTEGTSYLSDQSWSDTSYVNYSTQWNTNPKVGGAWTWTQIDALQAGVNLYAYSTDGVPKCTQVYVEVDYTAVAVVAPTVTTDIATISTTQLQNNQATLKGNITNTGGQNADLRGFRWGTSPGSYSTSQATGGSFSTGEFNYQITLIPGTIYYYRAQAHNSAGWGYGAEKRVVIYQASGGQKSFKTLEACECTSTTIGGCCDGCNYCPAGTVFNGSSCSDATATIKCASTVNKCTAGNCSGEKRYPECSSGGVCDSSATSYYASEAVLANNGYVLKADCSQVALSCTDYCGTAGNICTGDRYQYQNRQACGGTGSCNGSVISCLLQDCGVTSNTCSSKCQKDYTYTCSAGTCGTYHTYTTASQGYYCSAGNLINTGSCAVSTYNGRSADKCDKKRDLYRCNGLGSTDANCIFDVGDEWAYVSAYKIANSSGQEVDASSADNTGTCHSCTEGSCSGTLKWSECDGSGNPGPCATYNQTETVYPSAGYTLTSTCGTTGTTNCDTNFCWDGAGHHEKCDRRCNTSHVCDYYNCVNHCTNTIQDCDETGFNCGGSCPSCDTTPPTTTIKVKRKSTGEDLTAAGSWLRADTYTIQFEDKDQADGSGSNCENCSCEYSIYSCDVGGTNCNTPVVSLTSRTPNFSFDIVAGKTAPTYNLEGAGRYRIYSGARDMAGNSAFQYRYINFDFTPPKTEFK